MPLKISEKFKQDQNYIAQIVSDFNSSGELFGNGDRNKIKLFDLNGKTINIKSFKIPNIVNKVAYKYFRKSKARRSFEYATILLEKGIGTPEPIAFFENFNFIGLKDSYYVSEHLVT
ncbi:MAG TPA: Kdo domain containing protein, partial [Flavobacterium sp.]|nr:Kdo domain containing protein [Flavobacterium sp.]